MHVHSLWNDLQTSQSKSKVRHLFLIEAFFDLSSKLEFTCLYKVQGLPHTPLGLDYWPDPENYQEALLVWGDTGGAVNVLHFLSAATALFERPPAPAGHKQGERGCSCRVLRKQGLHCRARNAPRS